MHHVSSWICLLQLVNIIAICLSKGNLQQWRSIFLYLLFRRHIFQHPWICFLQRLSRWILLPRGLNRFCSSVSSSDHAHYQ